MTTNKPLLTPADFDHYYAPLPDLTMHYVAAGPVDGKLVILLHGFPEFWYSWRHQIVTLAEAGYRVVAPDQRGYNLTEKQGYFDIWTLSQDIVYLLDYLKHEKAIIVGHDWGAIIAWTLAALHESRVEKLTILNVPNPAAAAHGFSSFDFAQWARSWYIFFFQIPELPEKLLSDDNYTAMRAIFKQQLGDKVSNEELQYFIEAWSQPGALTAMLNWYRQLGRKSLLIRNIDWTIYIPTMILWGDNDTALGNELAIWSLRWVQDGELHFIHASHWVQQDAPEEVNAHLLRFLQG